MFDFTDNNPVDPTGFRKPSIEFTHPSVGEDDSMPTFVLQIYQVQLYQK